MDPDQSLPERIGRYKIVSELGRGMMGVVYKADDSVMGRTVALKVIRLVFPVTPEQREAFEQRFVAEARIMARLSHPNIVVAYDVGRDGAHGNPYMALEYLVGRTLSQSLQQGPALGWQEALRVTARVAEALHYAHGQGVVHRDVKPANIMLLESGEPKLMDFGLAKLHAGFELTASGQFMGTPLYMSPEQATGVAVDGRSDLFSLGSVLYTLVTGTRAFDADSVPRIVNRVAYDQPLPPTRLARELPAAIDYVLARALAKPPEARYPDGRSLAQDLEDVLAARAPRHRADWNPPRAGELTMATSGGGSEPEPAEGEGSRSAAQRLMGRDETTSAPRPVRRRSGPFAILVLSMLAFGLVLYSSPFWREYLARRLALLPETTRPAAPGSAPSATPEAGPAATDVGTPAETGADVDAAAPEASPSEIPPEPSPEPSPLTAPIGPTPDPAPSVQATPTPSATPVADVPSPTAAVPAAAASAAPRAARTPATAKEKPKATARLSISLTHDLKSGRLKVDVDGETVCDQTLRAKQKPYLLLLKRREGSLDRTLPVVPGQRRLTLEVRSGQRKETKELVERFKAGETRHFDLKVTSSENGFRFEWE